MDIYFLDTDQPTTCPLCGARTHFDEIYDLLTLKVLYQIHACLRENCRYKFIGEFENEHLFL